jgi:hypothetical protein
MLGWVWGWDGGGGREGGREGGGGGGGGRGAHVPTGGRDWRQCRRPRRHRCLQQLLQAQPPVGGTPIITVPVPVPVPVWAPTADFLLLLGTQGAPPGLTRAGTHGRDAAYTGPTKQQGSSASKRAAYPMGENQSRTAGRPFRHKFPTPTPPLSNATTPHAHGTAPAPTLAECTQTRGVALVKLICALAGKWYTSEKPLGAGVG